MASEEEEGGGEVLDLPSPTLLLDLHKSRIGESADIVERITRPRPVIPDVVHRVAQQDGVVYRPRGEHVSFIS